MRRCDVDGCGRGHVARGLCGRHVQRWYKRGHLRLPDDAARFWAKVDATAGLGGCWVWTASIAGEGYGAFTWQGRQGYAHRYAYERAHGPIADGLAIDHLCSNRRCVNPRHLEPVTPGENVRRSIQRGRGRWISRDDRPPVELEKLA